MIKPGAKVYDEDGHAWEYIQAAPDGQNLVRAWYEPDEDEGWKSPPLTRKQQR